MQWESLNFVVPGCVRRLVILAGVRNGVVGVGIVLSRRRRIVRKAGAASA